MRIPARRRAATAALAVVLALTLAGNAAAERISVGVFTLFRPREVVLRTTEPGRYEMRMGTTSLCRWTGGPKSKVIAVRLTPRGLFTVTEFQSVAWEEDARPGDRLTVLKDGVAGLPFSFTLAFIQKTGFFTRDFRGSLSFLLDVSQAGSPVIPVVTEDIEQYCGEVVASELPEGMPEEALKAQAVACRSYALFYRGKNRHGAFDFCDTTHCQFFKGAQGTAAAKRAVDAAAATKGVYLASGGKVVPGYYCGCCAGVTATPELIWGSSPAPGAYVQVSCPHPASDRFAKWERRIGVSQPGTVQSGDIPWLLSRSIAVRDTSPSGGYVRTVSDGGNTISGEQFRSLVCAPPRDWNTIPGMAYTLRREGDDLVFEGCGLGHGIGLCQSGATELARKGKAWKEILAHYFPGLTVVSPGQERTGGT